MNKLTDDLATVAHLLDESEKLLCTERRKHMAGFLVSVCECKSCTAWEKISKAERMLIECVDRVEHG